MIQVLNMDEPWTKLDAGATGDEILELPVSERERILSVTSGAQPSTPDLLSQLSEEFKAMSARVDRTLSMLSKGRKRGRSKAPAQRTAARRKAPAKRPRLSDIASLASESSQKVNCPNPTRVIRRGSIPFSADPTNCFQMVKDCSDACLAWLASNWAKAKICE